MPDAAPPRPLRPQPISATIAEPLAARAQAIAKGWLLVLLERAPLESIGAISTAELAAEGPALCAAAARALCSDAELARLEPTGDLAPLARRIGPLTAAEGAAAVIASVEALRACLWAAALDAEALDAAALAALAERLAAVAASLAATALDAAAAVPVGDDAEPAEQGESRDPALTEVPRAGADPREGAAGAMADGELWIATLERHLDQARREGGGLALLRVELVDADRLVASASPEERGVPYGRLAQAIRRAIRRQDLVASDHDGRAWVIAPAVGRAGAIALAERIGAGVEHGERFHGAPLAATIGFAVYGEDGEDSATLIERADGAMLAASAAGVRIGEASAFDDADPGRPGPRLVR